MSSGCSILFYVVMVCSMCFYVVLCCSVLFYIVLCCTMLFSVFLFAGFVINAPPDMFVPFVIFVISVL